MRGGLLDLSLGYGLALLLLNTSWSIYFSLQPYGGYWLITHDRLLSPSLLKLSMILVISLLPSLASTLRPPILMLTFSSLLTISSRLSKRCLMLRQTNTPQSDPFSWTGLSSKGIKSSCIPNISDIFIVAVCASLWLPGGSES